jgi:hypothetical protein
MINAEKDHIPMNLNSKNGPVALPNPQAAELAVLSNQPPSDLPSCNPEYLGRRSTTAGQWAPNSMSLITVPQSKLTDCSECSMFLLPQRLGEGLSLGGWVLEDTNQWPPGRECGPVFMISKSWRVYTSFKEHKTLWPGFVVNPKVRELVPEVSLQSSYNIAKSQGTLLSCHRPPDSPGSQKSSPGSHTHAHTQRPVLYSKERPNWFCFLFRTQSLQKVRSLD